MVYDPSQDGSDMDAATWIAMRDALKLCVEAIDDIDGYNMTRALMKASEAGEAALKLAGVKL